MRTLSTNTEQIKLRELIEAARKEPVTVLENGEPAVVVLSPAEFDRLDEQDRIRREAKASARDDRCDSPGRERARSGRDGA
jgi:prevent-host-death family protein